MAIYDSHIEQQQLQSQPDSAKKSAPSTYIHDCEDTGVTKRTVVSDDGFDKIPVASPSTSLPFSDVAPPSICDPALPRPFGPGRCFVVDERVYWTEDHDNAKFELQVAIYDYDIDDLRKTRHARFLRCPERTVSNRKIQEKNGSVAREPNTGVYNDDDDDEHCEALLCAKNAESCSNALLQATAAEHDPWEELGDGHYTVLRPLLTGWCPSEVKLPAYVSLTADRTVRVVVPEHQISPRIPGGCNNRSVCVMDRRAIFDRPKGSLFAVIPGDESRPWFLNHGLVYLVDASGTKSTK
ncbi:hypothetical protein HPB49_024216 [Dermacentor silvarum]|uniref:Uncharacterized protein n=1 Tax=Dermacentor silvarum TaxID=543639 RepID=A0ACB8DH41_DERSI|nr:hypothetical protein HPB49_024216 [Dermacentor silvarum]